MIMETPLHVLKVLANETRLKLLGLVAERERSVGALAALLKVTEPTISHHLARLQQADLVRMRAAGTTHYYRLKVDTLNQVNRALLTPQQVVSLAADIEGADAWERKVLRTFVEDGRLTKIPDTRKKRTVILKWLVHRFEEGVRYTERELNAIIKRHHPDCATLRRELIASRLVRRENGIYWRLPLPSASEP